MATRVDLTLYGIVDPEYTAGRRPGDVARGMLAGGASLLQVRDKRESTRRVIETVEAVIEAADGSGVPVLVNDRVDVAFATGADGVHLGQEDMPIERARGLLGREAIIGLTIKQAEHVRADDLALADYACIGGVFDTSSKRNPCSIGLDGWRDLAAKIRKTAPDLPLGAIAGITHENVAAAIGAGADGVAVISALSGASDVEDATRSMRQRIEGARHA